MRTLKRIAFLLLALCLILGSTELTAGAKNRYGEDELGSAEVGDIVIFGEYEQDNNTDNGKEPIEWIVLAKKEDRILVVSRYALDAKKFHDRLVSVTWPDCTLREWLNEDFMKKAFTEEQRDRIPTVTVKADQNLKYKRNTGGDTKDQIFLLSTREAKKYFSSNAARSCKPTAYAKAHNCYVYSGYCWWWTRTPGNRVTLTSAIKNYGEINNEGYPVHCGQKIKGKKAYGGVRPAMWISVPSEGSDG